MKQYLKILFANKRILISLIITLFVLISTIQSVFFGYSDAYPLTFTHGWWVVIVVLIPLFSVVGLLYLVYQKYKLMK